jgi:hypothetical protein
MYKPLGNLHTLVTGLFYRGIFVGHVFPWNSTWKAILIYSVIAGMQGGAQNRIHGWFMVDLTRNAILPLVVLVIT